MYRICVDKIDEGENGKSFTLCIP